MPKYSVTLKETMTYTVEVESDDVVSAVDDAIAAWAHSEDPDNDFAGMSDGVEFQSMDLIEDGEESEED